MIWNKDSQKRQLFWCRGSKSPANSPLLFAPSPNLSNTCPISPCADSSIIEFQHKTTITITIAERGSVKKKKKDEEVRLRYEKLRKTWEEDQSSRWVGATTRRRRSMTLRYMICSEEGQRPCCNGMTWGHPYDIYIFDSIWFGVCNEMMPCPSRGQISDSDSEQTRKEDGWEIWEREKEGGGTDCCWGCDFASGWTWEIWVVDVVEPTGLILRPFLCGPPGEVLFSVG